MSRTYQALRKAEAENRQILIPPAAELAIDERSLNSVHLKSGATSQVEYQKLRVWLTNPAGREQPLQTVMIVSCRAGTGSTTTATLLARTLAEGKNFRVLIIDGNFRTSSLNRAFKVKNNGGFTEIVSTGAPFEAHIQPTDRQNLFVLTTGRISLLPAEVFEGKAIELLLDELKQKFDFIIFDAAPVIEFPDSYALAPKVDGIILVVEAERTSIDEAQRAKRNIEQAGGRLLGVVLNRRKDYIPARLRKFFHIPS
jgi:capsular exopolysaccharide synthesis family protein